MFWTGRNPQHQRNMEQFFRQLFGQMCSPAMLQELFPVVCGDRQLLFEEAPTAYKRIEQVVDDLVTHKLATPVAATVPLVTYKTADAGPATRRDRQHRRRDRR